MTASDRKDVEEVKEMLSQHLVKPKVLSSPPQSPALTPAPGSKHLEVQRAILTVLTCIECSGMMSGTIL